MVRIPSTILYSTLLYCTVRTCSAINVRYGSVPYRTGTVDPGNYFGLGTVPSTQNPPKAPGDVFCSVLCGPNEHKDYLSSARGNSSLMVVYRINIIRRNSVYIF